MASIDSSLVRDEIRAMISVSNALRNQTLKMFEQMEADPSAFPELDEIDPSIADEFDKVTIRKVYIRSGRHDFRVVFAHWTLDDEAEHVDILLVFSRKKGYRIDWRWMIDVLRDSAP